MKIGKIVNNSAVNGEVTGYKAIVDVTANNITVMVLAETGNIRKRLVSLAEGEIALFSGQTAVMEQVKADIDALYTDETEKPTKGTHYRAIMFKVLQEEGKVLKNGADGKAWGVTAELESKSVYGLFLKRLSDYIRNNYEVKPEKASTTGEDATTGETGEDAATEEMSLQAKRMASIATLTTLFEGDDAAQKLLAKLAKLA